MVVFLSSTSENRIELDDQSSAERLESTFIFDEFCNKSRIMTLLVSVELPIVQLNSFNFTVIKLNCLELNNDTTFFLELLYIGI